MLAIRRFPVLLAPFFQNRQEVIVHCVHLLISGYWSAYWSNPRLRSMSGAGDAFQTKSSCCCDRSFQSEKCQALFSGQTIHPAPSLPYRVVRKCINKRNDNKKNFFLNFEAEGLLQSSCNTYRHNARPFRDNPASK